MLLPEQVACTEQLEGTRELMEQTHVYIVRYARCAAGLSGPCI